MDRLTSHHIWFASPTHYQRGGNNKTQQLLDEFERVTREVAALRSTASPLVAVARRARAEVERIQGVPELSEITERVAQAFGTTELVLRSPLRDQQIAFRRQIGMYLCRSVGRASLPAIGRHFRRHYTTVIHAVGVIERRMREDAAFARNIQQLEYELRHRPNVSAVAVAA